ncbi:MAG: peptidase M50 [Methanotrichaceae archaeon]|nr:peptidase M50 [Methanotrichaceae archaeon]
MLIGAVAVSLYSLLLLPISKSEKWRKRGISTWGPIPVLIFFRTTRGLKLLDRLARPKLLWRIGASAGVPLVILSMSLFLFLLLNMAYLMIQSPPEPSSYNQPRNILLIPGLNEYIPFVWGWIALFVTMVVHEFAHGILSRVEGVKVKSMGLVTFFLAPIAAFVEPDEEELFGTKDRPPLVSKGARIRILSAGVISNFLVAAVAMALFFGPVIGSISPVDRVIVADVQSGSLGDSAGFQQTQIILDVNGEPIATLAELSSALQAGTAEVKVYDEEGETGLSLSGKPQSGIAVSSVLEGYPAIEAGLPSRTVISKLDGQDIAGLSDFRQFMNSTSASQAVTVTTADGSVYYLTLVANPDGSQAGFMGIAFAGDEVYADAVYYNGVIFQQAPSRQFLAVMKAIPASGPFGLLYLLSLPFTGVDGFTEKGFPGFSGWITTVFEPTGWGEFLGGRFFWIANLLLWVGWINLYAGLFNCLPAVPLDGGHIFRDLVQAGFERVVSVREAERLTRTVVAFLAWLVLTSLVITIVAPFTHGLSL